MSKLTITEQLDLMFMLSQEMGHKRDAVVRRFKEVTGCTGIYANNLWRQMQSEVGASDGFGARVVRYLDKLEEALDATLDGAKKNGSYVEFTEVAKRLESALGLGAKSTVNLTQNNTQINSLANQLASLSPDELRRLAQPNQPANIGGTGPARTGASPEGGSFIPVQAEPRGTD